MPPAPSAVDMIWADAHNHLQDPRIASPTDPGGVGDLPCLVNATSEDDWDAVLQITAERPSIRHAALGVHPWFAHLVASGWESRLRERLAAQATLAIGECGLDAKTRSCTLAAQTPVFETQLHLARELGRPLVIHCVAAWGFLLDVLGQHPPPARWMVHGFSGSIETARRLLAMGAFLSIPVRVLQPDAGRLLEVFANLPADRMLLETDAPNPPLPPDLLAESDSRTLVQPWHLPAIGRALADRLGFDSRSLAAVTHRNFLRFIGSGESSDR